MAKGRRLKNDREIILQIKVLSHSSSHMRKRVEQASDGVFCTVQYDGFHRVNQRGIIVIFATRGAGIAGSKGCYDHQQEDER